MPVLISARSLAIPALALLLLPLDGSGRGTAHAAPAAASVTVDFSRRHGRLRALQGINKGPLVSGGLVDLTTEQRALGVPWMRLHDCHWPNPDVVDIHAVFPDPAADPDLPASYDFRLTDEYVAAARATGAELIYRLGESIEHTATRRFVHPPADPARWARVALGIVRHYNDGWAGGHHYGVRYWEVWNEPENRPSCWTGTDDQYFRLYAETTRLLKARYPELQVGGPAVGFSGEWKDGTLTPSAFVRAFLDYCRRERLPLDFFSWHCYTDSTAELAGRAREVRRLLDEAGFPRAESHLNEWNYLPDGSWSAITRTASPADRQRFYDRMEGPPGAAFLASALVALQDAPLNVACLFHGEAGPFGLFRESGLPNHAGDGVLLFRRLLDTPQRAEATAAGRGLATAAGTSEDGKTAQLLIAATGSGSDRLALHLSHLPWDGRTNWELRRVDASHRGDAVERGQAEPGKELELPLPSPGVLLLTLHPATAP